ncbi:hypothetical protein DFH09DRAFT_1355520 [Mycena vulgaris]|nr:hypothetical protein DFH09DRAFT_1355520 [Mycena vulgaris]
MSGLGPLHNTELQERNVRNLRVERSKRASSALKRAYEAARATLTGAGNLDVGMPLESFFGYTDEEKDLMVSSKELFEAVGPLPIFLIHCHGTFQDRARSSLRTPCQMSWSAEQPTALATPERVLVVDVAKATKLYGSEEIFSTLDEPLAPELLAARQYLCPMISTTGLPHNRPQYLLHRI